MTESTDPHTAAIAMARASHAAPDDKVRAIMAALPISRADAYIAVDIASQQRATEDE